MSILAEFTTRVHEDHNCNAVTRSASPDVSGDNMDNDINGVAQVDSHIENLHDDAGDSEDWSIIPGHRIDAIGKLATGKGEYFIYKFSVQILRYSSVHNLPNTSDALDAMIDLHNLSDLLSVFIHDQPEPNEPINAGELASNDFYVQSPISIFPFAVATFFTPSDTITVLLMQLFQ